MARRVRELTGSNNTSVGTNDEQLIAESNQLDDQIKAGRNKLKDWEKPLQDRRTLFANRAHLRPRGCDCVAGRCGGFRRRARTVAKRRFDRAPSHSGAGDVSRTCPRSRLATLSRIFCPSHRSSRLVAFFFGVQSGR